MNEKNKKRWKLIDILYVVVIPFHLEQQIQITFEIWH